MWIDPQGKLVDHLQKTSSIQIESLILAEWNMNDFQEIDNYGTYRYRPITASSAYYRLPLSYDPLDSGNYYDGVERSFFTYSNFVQDNDEPVLFESEDVDRKLYFDLEQCFYPFRPRSGINKLLYFDDKYIENISSARRPRYYMASRYDTFKYWNSFRTQVENNEKKEYGVSYRVNPINFNENIGYFIEDTAPFVIYKNAVPTNRIVIKMQTNLAKISNGEISVQSGTTITDPLADRSKSSIPKRWKIEYLDNENNWIVAGSFDENSQRSNGSAIVDWDGYVELFYGVNIPSIYRSSFHFVGYADSISNIPIAGANNGEAYIIGLTENSPGQLYIWNSQLNEWYIETATYGFSLYEYDDTKKMGILSSLTDSPYYLLDGRKKYTEFIYVKGLRISVETMTAPNQTFDLIELSPRLKVNISDYVISFNINKSIANDSTQLPVGSLIASTGDIVLMNVDDAFTKTNTSSIVANYLKPNIKFDIYEIVLNVSGYNKYIPIQSMYSEIFQNSTGGMNQITVPLRDQFFRFETMRAPDIFLTDTTLTSAVAILLDHCGFSNYIFKGFDDRSEIQILPASTIDYPIYYPPLPPLTASAYTGTTPYVDFNNVPLNLQDAWNKYWQLSEQYNFSAVSPKITNQNKINYYASINDPVIPFFFINSESSVAQILDNLAKSTQTAMFFDEDNNFVIMPKEYLMPANESQRGVDLILYGQTENNNLSNIININASEEQILNDGTINYSIKYIQKEFSKLSQAQYSDIDKIYTYKPVLLWEVGSNQEVRSNNDNKGQSSGYALTAVTLNTSLTASVPYVQNNTIINNVISIGESAIWLGRFQGYLYANGEIIRYDAVEYNVSNIGNVWITSNREYQNYFSKLSFKGKIYPTGNIRIFSEPYYEDVSSVTTLTSTNSIIGTNVRYKNGDVQRHGRGQFGTSITEHSAGLSDYWSSDTNVRGINMKSSYLFGTTPIEKITYPSEGSTSTSIGVDNELAKKSKRNGIIRNFLRRSHPTDDVIKKLKSTSSGTIQSSALVFVGPSDIPVSTGKINFVSYIYKELDSAYRHFGTRMRVIGRYEIDPNKGQSANNGSTPVTYYNIQPENVEDKVNIDGGSGGIAIGINPSTNHGYFFEICALTGNNIQQYNQVNQDTGQYEKVLHNIVFYKTFNSNGEAIPKKLWGGIASIIVDEGLFIGQDRIGIQDNPTVYDLAVEYEDRGSTRRFYLYVNNKQIAYVDDPNPLPQYNNIALFVRGESECMFENVYALQSVISSNSQETVISEIADAFGDDTISTSEAMRKYSVSGFIKPTYLSGISGTSAPKYKMYFEEFGTILRECAYFNIRYDKAYPALLATIAPTFNNERGYAISGFRAGAYGAEFLLFNTTDKAIVLDETTGNYLRILGVTFTQETSSQLTVDEYFNRLSSFSNPVISSGAISSPIVADKIFENIKSSRKKYGKREFSIDSEYIQSHDDAGKLMEWIMSKALRKRDRLTINVFGVPHIQLGDLVAINYKLSTNITYVDLNKVFVVQGITNSKDSSNKSTQLTLIEV